MAESGMNGFSFGKLGCFAIVAVAAAFALVPREDNGNGRNSPEWREASERVDAEMAVKRALRDPQSAQFVHIGNGCGTVNSRNAFGGYTGRQRFIRLDNGVALERLATDRQGFEDMWQNRCRSR